MQLQRHPLSVKVGAVPGRWMGRDFERCGWRSGRPIDWTAAVRRAALMSEHSAGRCSLAKRPRRPSSLPARR